MEYFIGGAVAGFLVIPVVMGMCRLFGLYS